MHNWYSTPGSMGQGLIADEETGKNIAVAYDSSDAPMLTAAPKMYRAILLFLAEYDAPSRGNRPEIRAAHEAIADIPSPIGG